MRPRILAPLLLVCLSGTPAFAHAFLAHAVPAVGAALPTAPPALTLTYTEPVEPLFSRVTVEDSAGASVVAGAVTASDGGRTLTVPLKPLAAGRYQVDWHIVSVDTHRTEGHFTFTVGR